MKHKKAFLNILLMVVMLVIPLSTQVSAKTTNNTQSKGIALSKVKILSKDATVKIDTTSQKGKDQIHITTAAAESDYSTPVLYWNQQIQAKNYGEFDFYIQNPNKDALKLNLNVTSKAYGSLDLLKGAYVSGQQADTKENVFFPVDDYGFEIPGEFEGYVKIPFYLFKDKDSNLMLQHNLGVLSYMGITIICKKGSDIHFTIADPSLVRTSDVIAYTTIAEQKIIGKDQIAKPSYGKIFTNYEVYSYDMLGNASRVAADFSLKYEAKGIDIDQDGRIIVSSQSNAKSIVLLAKVAGQADVQRQIKLQNSWTTSVKTQNGYNASVPKESEVKKISTNQGFFYSDTAIDVFWGVCLFVFLVFSMFYIKHRHPNIFSKKKK